MALKTTTKVLQKQVRGSANPALLVGRVLFTPAQRRQLARAPLSLETPQIDAIQSVLGGITLSLRGGPTVAQQRAALERMAAALEDLEGAFAVASDLIDKDGLGLALRKRLDDAHRDDKSYRDDARLLLEQATRLGFTVNGALSVIPKGAQARQRTAHYWPIKLIDDALQPHAFPVGGKEFREVCEIAYEAATGTTIDPERAIRAYLKHRRTAATP